MKQYLQGDKKITVIKTGSDTVKVSFNNGKYTGEYYFPVYKYNGFINYLLEKHFNVKRV